MNPDIMNNNALPYIKVAKERYNDLSDDPVLDLILTYEQQRETIKGKHINGYYVQNI
jgi:hypothetical protein